MLAEHFYHALLQHRQEQWPDLVRAFALFLKEERILRYAGKIIIAFEHYVLEQQKQRKVTIESAQPLSPSLSRMLAVALKKTLAGEPMVEERVQPELIGGIRLRLGDKMIDASIKRKLQTLV